MEKEEMKEIYINVKDNTVTERKIRIEQVKSNFEEQIEKLNKEYLKGVLNEMGGSKLL